MNNTCGLKLVLLFPIFYANGSCGPPPRSASSQPGGYATSPPQKCCSRSNTFTSLLKHVLTKNLASEFRIIVSELSQNNFSICKSPEEGSIFKQMQLKHKNGKEKHDLLIEAEFEWLGDRKMFLRFQRKGLS